MRCGELEVMSLPIFISPFEDPSDIDFFEFDVYVLQLDAFDPEGTEVQFQIVEEFGDGALFYLTPDYNELAFIADPDFEASQRPGPRQHLRGEGPCRRQGQ